MDRNYKKEFALALKELSKVTEEKFAYQSLYDDALKKLQEYENTPSSDVDTQADYEETQYQEVE